MKILVFLALCLSASLAQVVPSYFLISPQVSQQAPAEPAGPVVAVDAVDPAEPAAVEVINAEAAAASEVAEIVAAPEDPMGPVCASLAGEGATSFLQNVVEVMLDTMARDMKTRGAVGYFASVQFQQNLALLQRTPDYQMLQDFACRDMFVDLDFFFTWLVQRAAAPPPPRAYAGLPKISFEKLIDMSQFTPSLMRTFMGPTSDRTMQSLYMAYNSKPYEIIADRVENTRAYKRMEDQLDVFNVELQKIGEFFEEILYQHRRYYFRQQRQRV